MRNLVLLIGLCFALPLMAQQTPPATPPPATPPASQAPTLEKPGMAEPEPEPAAKTPPASSGTAKTIPPKPAAKPGAKSTDLSNATTVEEIIARVNNEIITKSEYEKALASAEEDSKNDCQTHCTAEQLSVEIEDRRKHALRDLIDQSLLVQRAKDLGTSVEPGVIKKLDQIRIQNKLGSMEDLEKAVTAQGINWEDFKNNIRNGLLTQQVIGSEVGSHITISAQDVQKYYEAHKTEYVRPEEVALREIEISTEGKKPDEIPDLKKKADTALKRVQDGEDFAEIAKRLSDGSTAKDGGFLGVYKRGELSKVLEDKVFTMKRNQLTDVMETKQGFLILQVLEHYDEGQQSLDKVQNEISEKLYNERLEPAVREYLKTLRQQSYVVIKPGYQDIAGGGNSEIQEVSATPEVTKSKKGHKKYGLFGKKSGDTSTPDPTPAAATTPPATTPPPATPPAK
jgi:peptidyl-prolyl cis-trans isomerase SurA